MSNILSTREMEEEDDEELVAADRNAWLERVLATFVREATRPLRPSVLFRAGTWVSIECQQHGAAPLSEHGDLTTIEQAARQCLLNSPLPNSIFDTYLALPMGTDGIWIVAWTSARCCSIGVENRGYPIRLLSDALEQRRKDRQQPIPYALLRADGTVEYFSRGVAPVL